MRLNSTDTDNIYNSVHLLLTISKEKIVTELNKIENECSKTKGKLWLALQDLSSNNILTILFEEWIGTFQNVFGRDQNIIEAMSQSIWLYIFESIVCNRNGLLWQRHTREYDIDTGQSKLMKILLFNDLLNKYALHFKFSNKFKEQLHQTYIASL